MDFIDKGRDRHGLRWLSRLSSTYTTIVLSSVTRRARASQLCAIRAA